MKTRILLSFCLTFVLSLFCQIHAQFQANKGKAITTSRVRTPEANEMVYAFCGDGVINYVNVDKDAEVKFYIRIPAKQWKGCKITNVEVGFGYEAGKDSYVFISKDIEGEPVLKQDFQCDTIPVSSEGLIGWKKIPLSNSYTIDSDDDLYIGLYGIQFDWGIIGTDDESPVDGGNTVGYRRAGETDWTYQNMPHNVSLRITIAGDNIPQNHLRPVSCSANKQYYKPGETVSINGTVMNEGKLPVSSFDISYQINTGSVNTTHITDVTIQPLETYDFQVESPITEEGKGKITLTVSNPNGKPDDFTPTTSMVYDSFGCLAKCQKNVLVEELVGTDDEKAVAAYQIIKDAVDNCERKGNVIWVQNHAISDDEYSIKGYKGLTKLYSDNGVVFTPAVNIDHQMGIPGMLMLDKEQKEVPAETEMFIINSDFSKHLNACLDMGDVYFSLKLKCEVVDDDVLKIKIEAKPALEGLFPPVIQPSIALLLTEDNITGKQAGAEGDYIHNGVPRAFINDGNPEYAYIGDEIQIPNEGFTLETKYIIPDPTWKIENLNLICYIMDGNMILQNSAICPVKKIPDGIKQTKDSSSDFSVYCKDGTLHVEGEFDLARIITMNGQQVITSNKADISVSKLNKGIYCVLLQKGNRFVSEKFVVE